jgi:hypothetical protein
MMDTNRVLKEREEQLAKFKVVARELACEESEELYNILLRQVAQQKPMRRRTPTSEFAKDV